MAFLSYPRRPLAAALLSFLATGVAAQTLTISPGTTVQAGALVTFNYSNPGLPNRTVVVQITGGIPPTTYDVVIVLDANGNGSGTWTVPAGWRKGYVNAPGCAEQIITID